MDWGRIKTEGACEIVRIWGGLSNEQAHELLHAARKIRGECAVPMAPEDPAAMTAGSAPRGLVLDLREAAGKRRVRIKGHGP